MLFEWDEAKNRANVLKHGIDFNDVPGIFQHPMLVLHDNRMGYGEERWITIGLIKTLIGVVVYTERRDGCDPHHLRPKSHQAGGHTLCRKHRKLTGSAWPS